MNAVHALKPAGIPVGINPQEWRQAIERRLNELLDQSFALITALDLMEVDPDFEPYLADTWGDDREEENEHHDGNPDDEDGRDAEPENDHETLQWALDPFVSQDSPAFHGN